MATKKSAGKRFKGVYYTDSKRKRYLDKSDRSFYVTYRDASGKQQWKHLGWASEGWTREAAQRERMEILEGIRKERYQPKAERLTFSEFMEEHYLPWANQNKQYPDSDFSAYRKWFEPRLGATLIKRIAPIDLEGLKTDMREAGRAEATVSRLFSQLRHAFNWAIRVGLLEGHNPCRNVRIPRVRNNRRERFLTPEEAEMILQAAADKDFVFAQIVAMSLYGGLRRGEVLRIRWMDVKQREGFIHILDTKTGEPRPCYITEPVQDILDELTPGRPDEVLFPIRVRNPGQSISKNFKKLVDSLGLNEGVTDPRHRVYFHTLRHTFASWMVQDGVPLYHVGKALGHSTTHMTERYGHLAPENKKMVFERMAKIMKDRTHSFRRDKMEAE